MQYNEKLDAALAALKGDMVETLQRWVRVPSVRAERSAENAPFGADVRRAQDTAMADLKRLGFEPRDGIAATRKSVRAMTLWRCWRIWTSCPRATVGTMILTARRSSTDA